MSNSDQNKSGATEDEAVEEAEQPIPDSSSSSSGDTGLGGGADDSAGFLNVLRYLLQGNSSTDLRIRLLSNSLRDGAGESEDSDDDDTDATAHYYNLRRRYQSKIPKPPDKPDTSVIDQSEIKQQMIYESGCLNPLRRHHSSAFSSVAGLLCVKEIGQINTLQTVGNGPRVSASRPYLPTKHRPTKLLRLADKFFCGIYNKDGSLFMSSCQDTKIRIFDTSNGGWKNIKTVDCKDVGWSVLDVDFSHDGNHMIYSSWSEYIHICNIRGDMDTHKALYLNPGDRYRVGIFSLRFNYDDSEIVAAANSGIIYVFNRELGKRSMKIEAHADDLSSVCFADDSGHIIYSGGDDGVIKVWDRRSLKEESARPVGELAGHYDSITHIDSKGDARYLITNSKDQSIKLWDIRRFASSEGISATKAQVAGQDWDYRWHPYVGKVVKKKLPGDCSLMTYYGHNVVRTLIRARFSPPFNTGQRYIYSGDGFGRVIIYDLLTGKILRVLESSENKTTGRRARDGHAREVVRDMSWHPYENNLISSGWDGMIFKWECNIDSEEEKD